jgi:ERI1 exoribonuclease 2
MGSTADESDRRYMMKHIVVDLEMNPICQESEARRICTMENIEIGAIMLDDNLHEISSFRTYVKPEYNNLIMPKISKLTGITDAMVANAPGFQEAFKMFTNWCLGTGDEVVMYAWSTVDYDQIMKEIELKGYEMSEAEQRLMKVEWTDFQNVFGCHLGFERQISLKMALELAGVDFAGRQHDALDDARNTAVLLRIFNDKDLYDAALRKIEDAMTPKSLGNTLGNMFDFSMFSLT